MIRRIGSPETSPSGSLMEIDSAGNRVTLISWGKSSRVYIDAADVLRALGAVRIASRPGRKRGKAIANGEEVLA